MSCQGILNIYILSKQALCRVPYVSATCFRLTPAAAVTLIEPQFFSMIGYKQTRTEFQATLL